MYVEQPKEFVDPKFPNHVYELHKALYGLKQAPRAWYEHLVEYLTQKRYIRGVKYQTLFIKRSGSEDDVRSDLCG